LALGISQPAGTRHLKQEQTDMTRELTQREREGAATPTETPQQRNMRMGWGCACHGATFCPGKTFSHYEDDQPVFKDKE
jgi:hypothetical protein